MSVHASPLSRRQFNGDFWKFWLGQTISTFGSSFSSFAIPLLILKLTGSSLALAFSLCVSVLPYLFFGLVIGAWVDRVNRKRLMILTDLIRALVIASLFFVAQMGILSVWWIFMVAFLNSSLSIGFDAANFAAIPSMVSQEQLVTANGRIQAGYSSAKVIGPLLAGLLIIVVSLPALMLVDAVSFLVSAASILLIRTSFQAPADQEPDTSSLRESIMEGLRYVLKHRYLSWITLLLLLVNFIIPTAGVQVVLLAQDQFAASDTQLGLLYAAGSLGTVLCSLIAGYLGKRWSPGARSLIALALDGLFIVLAALTPWFWLLLIFWGARGGADVLFVINAYSLTQSEVPGKLIGRVITVTRVLTWSTAALGALIGGFAITSSQNIALVYVVIGLLIVGIALTFFVTPLGHAGQTELSSADSSQHEV